MDHPRFVNAAFDFVTDGESYRTRLKPRVRDDDPPPEALIEKRRSPWLRRVHLAGERAFVDFSGKRPRLTDPETGEVRDVELFVGVLGASHYTYVEAVESQRVEHWIGTNRRMVEFFGGVPEHSASS